MLAAGLATFNALYTTQAVLPTFVDELGISPSTAALTVSATTAMLAACIVPASVLSERWGRGRVLIVSALLGTAIGLALPWVHSPGALIAVRAVQGALLAGVPAVAMTWLSEEIHPRDLGRAMGIYIAGNTVGGLSGRLIPAGVLEIGSWRWALGTSAAVALAMAIILALTLPRQRNFHPKRLHLRHELRAMINHWSHPRVAVLFAAAFAGMGTFVSVYNYMGFRMVETFGLSEGLVGLVFVMYLAGTWSSARAGAIAERIGRGPAMTAGAVGMLLGVLLLAPAHLGCVLAGLFLFTAAFFVLHSTASSWIGISATRDRAEASSMYLLSYYLGSSVVGWASGLVLGRWHWWGLIIWLCAWCLVLICGSGALTAVSRHRS